MNEEEHQIRDLLKIAEIVYSGSSHRIKAQRLEKLYKDAIERVRNNGDT